MNSHSFVTFHVLKYSNGTQKKIQCQLYFCNYLVILIKYNIFPILCTFFHCINYYIKLKSSLCIVGRCPILQDVLKDNKHGLKATKLQFSFHWAFNLGITVGESWPNISRLPQKPFELSRRANRGQQLP